MSTLLIAHPDETLRVEMTAALGRLGHQVVEASSGDEAVKRAVDSDARLVLVSSHMPDRSGRDVCQLLRDSPGGKEMGILLMGPEFWERGVGGSVVTALGIDGFVALPCRTTSLVSAVEGVDQRFQQSAPSSDAADLAVVDQVMAHDEPVDPYALLGVGTDAEDGEIRQAFHALSERLHPDRHLAFKGSPVYRRVRTAYRRVVEAWQALSEPERRAAYDAGPGADSSPSPSPVTAAAGQVATADDLSDPNARKFEALGRAAEETGDFAGARMNYVFAQTYAADHPALKHAVVRMERALGMRADDPSPAPAPEPDGEAEPGPQGEAAAEDEGERPAGLPEQLPRHLAIIMDGNGRWAQARDLPRIEGHRQGAEAVRTVTRACRRWGIRHLTLYAFSEQNWARPEDEVAALMELLVDYVRSEREEIMTHGIRLDAVGALEKLPEVAQQGLRALMEESKDNPGMTLCLALSYGGREEIVEAARRACVEVSTGALAADALTPDVFRGFLSRPDLPDPDLVVRTSGEFRVSNFLLWQIAYAEFHISDTPWPDFGEEDLLAALQAFASRERRFGLTGEQVRDVP